MGKDIYILIILPEVRLKNSKTPLNFVVIFCEGNISNKEIDNIAKFSRIAIQILYSTKSQFWPNQIRPIAR